MNTDTGEIRKFDSRQEAIEAGFTRPLTIGEANHLDGMTRFQRLEWLRETRDRERAQRAREAVRASKRFKKRA